MTPSCTLPSLKRRRSLKHEIDFLIRCDSVEPNVKRAKLFLANQLSPSSPLPLPTSAPTRHQYHHHHHHHHQQQQQQQQAISCSECSFSSCSSAVLSAHARLHHPNKPYACGICGRCFGEKGNMNKHHRTVHLKQRKHACGECGRTFAFLDGLNRHFSMVHLDRRPFQCTICMCLVAHSRDVPCPNICGLRFKQKSHHRRHVRSVHHIELPR